MNTLIVTACLAMLGAVAAATLGAEPIGNVPGRSTMSLNGTWQVLVDRYDEGEHDYLSREKSAGWWVEREAQPHELNEVVFTDASTLEVPGDWNSQRDELFFYEGIVWYRRAFEFEPKEGTRTFLCFGGANKDARVWVNGQEVVRHHIGFTPFQAEVTGVLRAGTNVVHVRVDNTRRADGVPAMKTDWWNYGGITRRVDLVTVPQTFVRNASVGLDPSDPGHVVGWVQLDGPEAGHRMVSVKLDDTIALGVETDENGRAAFGGSRGTLGLWSPSKPTLHDFEASIGGDTFRDKVGLRTIRTDGGRVVLNGEPVVLRGVSIHEEAMSRDGRAWSEADARELLGLAKELGCNMVRLAHYTHNENMVRVADELGLMVWAEIPVYWTLEYDNPATLEEAKTHLREMVARDRNRASVIIWSIGNETGDEPVRTAFRRALGEEVRRLDPTRLLSAAMFARQVREQPGYGNVGSADAKLVKLIVDDPFGEMADILAINIYIGWYHDRPDEIGAVQVELAWDKPFMLSEFGAGVKRGLHGPREHRWTEEYGVWLYENTLAWTDGLPNFAGMTPWTLKDFRSPRRVLAGIQDWYNRKGLTDERGQAKDDFGVVREHYRELRERFPDP